MPRGSHIFLTHTDDASGIFLIIGILAGMSILVKQSTGLFVFGSCVFIYYAFFKKERLHVMFWTGVAIPLLIFGWWLYRRQLQKEFYNYCFAGVKTFSKNGLLGGTITWLLVLGIVFIVKATLKRVIKTVDQMEKRELLIMLSLAVGGSAVAYPIMDVAHVSICLFPYLVLGGCLGGKHVYEKEKEKWVGIFLIVIIAIGTPFLLNNVGNGIKWAELPHFRGILIQEKTEEYINEIQQYLKKHPEVYVLDTTAVAFHVPQGLYYKDFDMFLYGNLGGTPPLEFVKILESQQNAVVMILKDRDNLNRQFPVANFARTA